MKSGFWSVAFTVFVVLSVGFGCGPKESLSPGESDEETANERGDEEKAPDEGAGEEDGEEVAGEEATSAGSPPRAVYLQWELYSPKECLAKLNEGGTTLEFEQCVWNSKDATYESQGAIPLVCYDTNKRKWLDFSSASPPVECLQGTPQIETMKGGGVELTGDLVPAECGASGDFMPAVSAKWGDDSELAFIQGPGGSVEPPEEGDAITDQQKATIEKHLQEVVNDVDGSTMPPLQILQVARVELDGDGKPDILISASAPDPEDITYKPGGLFVVFGDESDKIVPIYMSSLEDYEVLGVSDLDGNGRQEILLQSAYYEGFYIFMEHLVGEDLVTLGGAGCGA